jgi:hypothetical protein
MEEGAHLTFKVPPPGIEFTLPSPKIGIESLPVVDPPWMPQVKTKVEEVTINQESHVSYVNTEPFCSAPAFIICASWHTWDPADHVSPAATAALDTPLLPPVELKSGQ